MLSVGIDPGPEFEDLNRRLQAMADGKKISRAMARRLTKMTDGVEDELKASVKGTRSRRGSRGTDASRRRGGHGLRVTVANSIKARVVDSGPTQGVRIYPDLKKMPDGQKKLPAYMDGQGRWRKPVFGNRQVWETQKGDPWFTPIIDRRLKTLAADAADIVDDIIKEI